MSIPVRLLPTVFAALLTVLIPATCVAEKVGAGAAAPTVKNRIVIQINEDDPKKWNGILGNIHNIQDELGQQNVAIAVVVIGQALGMLDATSLVANRVQDAMETGVEFLACNNSMRAQQVDKADLIEGTKVTAAGYVELMRRQQEGWTYLRP
jgi:uncharacterized protein